MSAGVVYTASLIFYVKLISPFKGSPFPFFVFHARLTCRLRNTRTIWRPARARTAREMPPWVRETMQLRVAPPPRPPLSPSLSLSLSACAPPSRRRPESMHALREQPLFLLVRSSIVDQCPVVDGDVYNCFRPCGHVVDNGMPFPYRHKKIRRQRCSVFADGPQLHGRCDGNDEGPERYEAGRQALERATNSTWLSRRKREKSSTIVSAAVSPKDGYEG